MLLYGSEQNARGVVNPFDELLVDNWRPPQGHVGYNTSGRTFQMLKRVFWLRKLEHGMHTLPANTVYSDHQVLVFSRGPYFFLVANEQTKDKKPSAWCGTIPPTSTTSRPRFATC